MLDFHIIEIEVPFNCLSLSPPPSLYRGLVPLHNACSYGHYEVVELLLKYNANVNAVDLWKFTPIHEAAAKGKYEICKLLLKVLITIRPLLYSV